MMAASLCRSPRRPLNVLAMCMAIQTVLFLCTTDIVTDSDGVSHTGFIYEGFALPHAILRLAGRDLTEKLTKILTEQGLAFAATGEQEIARDVKEKLSYIGLDCETELKSTAGIDQEKTFVLSDDNIFTVAPNVSVSRKCCSSHTVCIYEGFSLRVAGRDPTEDLMQILT